MFLLPLSSPLPLREAKYIVYVHDKPNTVLLPAEVMMVALHMRTAVLYHVVLLPLVVVITMVLCRVVVLLIMVAAVVLCCVVLLVVAVVPRRRMKTILVFLASLPLELISVQHASSQIWIATLPPLHP